MAPAGTRGARAAAPAAVLLVAALLVALALAPRGASAALTCSTVYNELMPCLGYVQSGGAVPRACCSGIKTLVSRARATPDRRAACACLKTVAAAAAGGPYLGRAAGLPGRCGVQPPFKIDPNVNCNAYVTPKPEA
ncbi:non-specific lipid-transfer protein 1-like isoform X1 [Triticum dicoccoides]|uniref:non-specific lipid-transfer protein 1-like isoform X1 n=1 Tax=Triticum dicoccoides TaxID=85692 RepID=UPI001890097C|nr:non-specific lipid-transfer protein 1-like isoform X1 [Triticum dicoccoides]